MPVRSDLLTQLVGCHSIATRQLPLDEKEGIEMFPIAADIAVNAMRDHAGSALPNAPVVPDPAPRESRPRLPFAAFLRASTRRRARLANRLDPCPGRPIW
jgi:hypothetical protein